jgi:hypothetical protein
LARLGDAADPRTCKLINIVMAGLDPAIHVDQHVMTPGVDHRDKPGDDAPREFTASSI